MVYSRSKYLIYNNDTLSRRINCDVNVMFEALFCRAVKQMTSLKIKMKIDVMVLFARLIVLISPTQVIFPPFRTGHYISSL